MSEIRDLQGILAQLAENTTHVRVVIIDERAGTGTERVYDTYHLELIPRLEARFRDNIARTLRGWPKPDDWEPYDSSYVPDDGVIAQATREAVTGSPLLSAIDSGLALDRVRLPAVAEPASHGVHGYAVVFVPSDGPRVIAVRRLDPVERLGRGRITAFILEQRLTDAEVTLAFDSGVDVLVADDTVLINHLAAFEALFFPPAVRAEAAVAVVRELAKRIEIGNLDDLVAVARSDSIFGGRLRRLARSEALSTATIPRIQRSLREFGWRHRFIVGDELRFDPKGRWRWPFLTALEDGLTESVGSGRLYRSNSQRLWLHRLVTAVRRDSDGVVTHLCGDDWGEIAVNDAAAEINNIVASYFVGTRDDPVEVVPAAVGSRAVVAALDDDARDRLIALPDCAPKT